MQPTDFLIINKKSVVSPVDIPEHTYSNFFYICSKALENEFIHCLNYFGYKHNDFLKCIICLADDSNSTIKIASFTYNLKEPVKLNSLSNEHQAMHVFERELHENFGLQFTNHPWLKPLRFAHDRLNKNVAVNDYPFYSIESEELHEVGVGPVHAGIIEPGHFRFICNGETVLHLEIQLGWQHRGIEKLMLSKKPGLATNLISENIAGDSVVAHSTAHAEILESLSETNVIEQIKIERAIALELERIAIHVGDISALCTDVAYHLGASVFSVLRTGIINFTQKWCGNRFGKSLIRIGGSRFPLTKQLRQELLEVLQSFEVKFNEMAHLAYHLPSLENRFDNIGTISNEQAKSIGAVGMVARTTNLDRDIRKSHPSSAYSKYPIETNLLPGGDVFARFLLRRNEITSSIKWIKNVIENYQFSDYEPSYSSEVKLKPNSFALSLTEGWRGEICHCAITDENGNLMHYKIKDPSVHNWKALELSLRNLEISDFPINNKSYNLSYCGHDL